MGKRYLLLLFIAAAFCSCSKEKKPNTPANVADTAGIVSAKIEAKLNASKVTDDVNFTIAHDTLSAVIPGLSVSKKLVVTFVTKATGTTVKVNDTLQVSGTTVTDFSKPVTYTVTTTKGDSKNLTVIVRNFTGLPILNITSAGPIVSKDNYVSGNVTINANMDFPQDVTSIPLQIRGRGNSTWVLFPKKPYRLKFNSKNAMLGMPAAKNWVLLANYDDKTLMRNYLAFALGRRLGADFTPQARFVEVVLNGEFLGNYLLTSQVEVDQNRVNITPMAMTDITAPAVTGGYLLELDQRLDGDVTFTTTKGIPFVVHTPDPIAPAQFDYIKSYVQQTEDVLFSANFSDPVNGYAKYINTDSFINWYLTEEVFSNQDGRDYGSMFYYKDRNGKLSMAAPWDFDISSGNCDYSPSGDPSGWYIRDAMWMGRLSYDNAFVLKVRQRWAAVRPVIIQQIFADIDQTAAMLKLSQQQNFTKWPILNQYVYPNKVVLGNYDAEVAYLKSFLTKKIAWMDANMASF